MSRGSTEPILERLRANDVREDVHFSLVAYVGEGGSGGVKAYRPEEIDTDAFMLGAPRPHETVLAAILARWKGGRHDTGQAGHD